MGSRKVQLAVVVMLTVVCSLPALALPPMGPPKATLGKNQLAIDFKYAYQEMDLRSDVKIRENFGLGWEDWFHKKWKIKDLTSNMFLGSLAYGICDIWDVFGQVGAADAEMAKICTLYKEFSGDYGLAWGFGTRATFGQEGDLTWGGLFQMTWSEPDNGRVKLRGDPNFSGDVELDFWEIQIAVGPTLQLDGLSIYGGPFFHFVQGDMNLKGSSVEGGATQLVEAKADIREESTFGGYGGIQWDITKETSWYTECQFTGNAWGIGTGVVWKFQ